MSRGDIARVFPDVDPPHRAARSCGPRRRRCSCCRSWCTTPGIKVVLTGEGADEMFAGYDLFREAKVRRFWARAAGIRRGGRACSSGSIPTSQRSPVAQRAMARQFFGRGLDRWREPGFGHDPRWRSTGALKRLFSADLRERVGDARRARRDCWHGCRRRFARWSPLAQDQYLEVHTLLSGYLLSSQGDRMLMAHSVEGRFPFLDRRRGRAGRVAAAATTSCSVLDEKHVLKRAAADLVPPAILRRGRSSRIARRTRCRSPRPRRREWIAEVASPRGRRARRAASSPAAVPQLARQVRARARRAGSSRTPTTWAVVGVLSTQLVHHQFIAPSPDGRRAVRDPDGRRSAFDRRSCHRRMLVHAFLERAARTAPDAPALIETTRRTSYAELDRLANRFANLLSAERASHPGIGWSSPSTTAPRWWPPTSARSRPAPSPCRCPRVRAATVWVRR